MLLIFSFTWWMVGFIVAQRNKPVVIRSAPGKPPWQQPKIIAMVPEKILLRISKRIHLWGREQARKNAAPKVSILQCSWHMKIGGCDGNCGAILVTTGAASTPVRLPVMEPSLSAPVIPWIGFYCLSKLSSADQQWQLWFLQRFGLEVEPFQPCLDKCLPLVFGRSLSISCCAMISVGDSELQDNLCTHTLCWKLCALPFITLFSCTFCGVPRSVNLRSCL